MIASAPKPWALVTGASEGIGEAFAHALASRGHSLVLVARRGDRLTALAALLRAEYGVDTRVLVANFSEPAAAATVLASTRELDIDSFVAAAGFGTAGEFRSLPLARELDLIDVNCRAVTALVHGIVPQLIARGGGRIILLGSIVGFAGVAGSATYAATKAYIQSLGEALHRELRPHGVRVTVAAPGPTISGFAARAGMRMAKAMAPSVVAEETLRAGPGTITVRPGFLTKFLDTSLRTVPRTLRSTILSGVIRGMIPR